MQNEELKQALAMIPVGWGVVEYLVSGIDVLTKGATPKAAKWILGGATMVGLAFGTHLDVTGDPNTLLGTILTGISMAGGAKMVHVIYQLGKAIRSKSAAKP